MRIVINRDLQEKRKKEFNKKGKELLRKKGIRWKKGMFTVDTYLKIKGEHKRYLVVYKIDKKMDDLILVAKKKLPEPKMKTTFF